MSLVFLPKPLEPQPCQFCQAGASYAPLEELEAYDVKVFFCYPCQAEYLYYKNDLLTAASVSLYAEVNHKNYRWTVFNEKQCGTLWWIKAIGIPGVRVNKDLIHLLSFDTRKEEKVPQLTPFDVAERILLWLPFL